MLHYIDLAIGLLRYAGLAVALYLFVAPFVAPVINNRIYINRLKRDYEGKQYKRLNKFTGHLQNVLQTVTGKNNMSNIVVLYLLSIGLFVLSLIVLTYQNTFSIVSLLISLFMGFTPYLFLRLRLRTIRIDGSYEAEGMVTELINQYKMNYFNMIEAIDKTIPHINGLKYSKASLSRLGLRVKDYMSTGELEEAIREFTFAINTEWVAMLGMNIQLSISDGANVTNSLEDILQDLKLLKGTVEKEKRDNNESFVMIRYFSFAILIFTNLAAMLMFQISFDAIIRFQLSTPVGKTMTGIIVISIIVNYAMLYLFRKPKYDF